MIRNCPGWLNYLLLWAFYSVIAFGIKFLTKSAAEPWFILLLMAVWSGGYLGKWKFFEKQQADGTVITSTSKFW